MSLCPNCSNQLLAGHTICLSCGHLIDNIPNLNMESLVSVARNDPFSGRLFEAAAEEADSESSLPENEAEP